MFNFLRDQIALNLIQGKEFLAKLDLNEELIFNSLIEKIKSYPLTTQITFLDYLCRSTSDFFDESTPLISTNIVIYKAARGKFDFDFYSSEEKELKVENNKKNKNTITIWLKMTGCYYFDSLYSNENTGFDMTSFPENFDPPHKIVKIEDKMDQLSRVFEEISKNKITSNFDSGFSNILESWSNKLKKMKETKKYCFIGESRVGKSTCINNLLGAEVLLPTSADIACTSSVISIGYSETLKISIVTMDLEELEELIETSREEYKDFPDGHQQKKVSVKYFTH